MFFTFAASSFNFRNSHWEPVIEPWGFGIKAAQDPATKAMSVKIESKESLNLDVTHNFLETLLSISDTMVQAQVGFQVLMACKKCYIDVYPTFSIDTSS